MNCSITLASSEFAALSHTPHFCLSEVLRLPDGILGFSVPKDSFCRTLAKKLKVQRSFRGTVGEVVHPIPIIFLITKLCLIYPSFSGLPRHIPRRIQPSAQFAHNSPVTDYSFYIFYSELLRPNGQSSLRISIRFESHFSYVSLTHTESTHCRSRYVYCPGELQHSPPHRFPPSPHKALALSMSCSQNTNTHNPLVSPLNHPNVLTGSGCPPEGWE